MAKRGKPLTRNMKEIISGHGLNVNEWRFVKQISESYMQFVNVETGVLKTLDVYKRRRRFTYEKSQAEDY